MIHFPETPEKNESLLRWASVRIPEWRAGYIPEKALCLGITANGEPCGVAIYHDLRPGTVTLSFAATRPSWATRGHIKEIVEYPFRTFSIHRLDSYTAKSNMPARRILKFAGFTEEGKLRKFSMTGEDMFVYSLLRDEIHGRR